MPALNFLTSSSVTFLSILAKYTLSTYDNRDETVIDLLEVEHQVFEPFPVGRLDKDTVGLLLLTNDGELNHRLISPKWKVDKVYNAKIVTITYERSSVAFNIASFASLHK